MSVEKLSDSSRVNHEKPPFVQIPNKVVEHIKDNDSFRVWAYLLSKSGDWKVIKTHLKNKFNFGNKKMKSIFSYLARANLIEYVQTKSKDGTFSKMDIHVLSGLNFDIKQEFKSTLPVGQKTGRAVNGTYRSGPLLNKETTKERERTKKRESIRKRKKRRLPLSDDFVPELKLEAVMQEKAKECGITTKEILDKFKSYHKAKGTTASDWQSELALFLIRERPKAKSILANNVKEIRADVSKQSTSFTSLEDSIARDRYYQKLYDSGSFM